MILPYDLDLYIGEKVYIILSAFSDVHAIAEYTVSEISYEKLITTKVETECVKFKFKEHDFWTNSNSVFMQRHEAEERLKQLNNE